MTSIGLHGVAHKCQEEARELENGQWPEEIVYLQGSCKRMGATPGDSSQKEFLFTHLRFLKVSIHGIRYH